MAKRFGSKVNSSINLSTGGIRANRGLVIGLILFVALIAFEIFNFDTTQFALESLLGNITFLGLQWATILAIAFCSIDFAGLNRIFTPESGQKEHREVWFLMGAWLLGATMNAVMTWWAVSVTLLNNSYGNEVLDRQQLLRYVPIFVAVLVWLTRILFIGSFSIAGETLFGRQRSQTTSSRSRAASSQPQPSVTAQNMSPDRINAAPRRAYNPVPKPPAPGPSVDNTDALSADRSRTTRVNQRPPVPNPSLRPRTTNGMQAKSR